MPKGFVIRLRDIRYKQLQEEQKIQQNSGGVNNVATNPLSKFTTSSPSNGASPFAGITDSDLEDFIDEFS